MEAVIFVGLQASGKSTFYRYQFSRTHLPISLDMLKTRSREKLLLNAAIDAKQPIVIDNTNITVEQRLKYIKKLKAAKFKVVVYYFEPDFNKSVEQNKNRKNSVPIVAIKATVKKLEPPSYKEGFDVIYSVKTDDGDFITNKLDKPIDVIEIAS